MDEVNRGSGPLPNVKGYAVLLALLWTVLIWCMVYKSG